MFVGLDYHKKFSVATKMDKKGKILEQIKMNNDPETLLGFADTLPKGSQIALEATGNWYYFYELMEEKGAQIFLAHPLKTRAIAEAKVKTDKIDSTMLAHLLRADLLPAAYIPPREIRDSREILRYRASLVSMQTSLKNRVHAILSKNGIIPEFSDIFGKKAKKFLKSLELRPCYKQAIDGYLRVVETLEILIKEMSEEIERLVRSDKRAELLTTIPGISYYSALLVVSEIGEVERFRTAKKLCSYAGLVPRVYSSGGKTHYGSITKQGSKWLRWILVESSHHFRKASKRMNELYERVCFRHGAPTARVAVAREMLKVIYYMLREMKPFKVVSG